MKDGFRHPLRRTGAIGRFWFPRARWKIHPDSENQLTIPGNFPTLFNLVWAIAVIMFGQNILLVRHCSLWFQWWGSVLEKKAFCFMLLFQVLPVHTGTLFGEFILNYCFRYMPPPGASATLTSASIPRMTRATNEYRRRKWRPSAGEGTCR